MSSNGASAASSLRVIVGPTAAGKSAIAMTLATEHGAHIISADSRQIYRGFDIGTAKPSREDRARVPHAGVDVADSGERWSAARFADAAGDWIADAERREATPVVVGGTGFWVSALVQPLAALPVLDEAARDRIARELAPLSHDALRARCAELDPPIAELGHAQWRRAIEVTLLTGRRLSEWQRDAGQSVPRAVRYLLVDPESRLRDHIAGRVDAMFAAGWAGEVRALSGTVVPNAIAWKACGYEQLRAAAAEGKAPESVRSGVVQETWQYARRQRTWFRRQLKHGPVTRIDPTARDAFDRAHAWWMGKDDE